MSYDLHENLVLCQMLYQMLYQICFLRHQLYSRKSLFKFYINLFNGQPENLIIRIDIKHIISD